MTVSPKPDTPKKLRSFWRHFCQHTACLSQNGLHNITSIWPIRMTHDPLWKGAPYPNESYIWQLFKLQCRGTKTHRLFRHRRLFSINIQSLVSMTSWVCSDPWNHKDLQRVLSMVNLWETIIKAIIVGGSCLHIYSYIYMSILCLCYEATKAPHTTIFTLTM